MQMGKAWRLARNISRSRRSRLKSTQKPPQWGGGNSRKLPLHALQQRTSILFSECLYVQLIQTPRRAATRGLHYELEQISKFEILRKLKQRFGGKIIRDVRFRVG